MLIPLNQIAVIDRGRHELGDLAALAESIKANGQITAGVVRTATPEDSKRGVDLSVTPYVLVAGGRRFAACSLAGIESFRADDFGSLPVVTQKILELEENLHRLDLTWDEQAAMRKQIHQLYKERAREKGEKWTLMDTARATGDSIASISRDIEIATAIEDDPKLKDAGSKKSAVRIIEMREHLARKELTTSKPVGKLQSLMTIADARDWLRQQPTASADLFLSDFPYGIDYYSSGHKNDGTTQSSSEYDDSEGVTLDLFVDVIPEALRITREVGWLCIFMCDSNYDYLKDLFESCCVTHFQYGENYWSKQSNGEWIKELPGICSAGLAHKRTTGGEDPGCRFVRAAVPGWIWYRPNSRNPTRYPERLAKNYYERLLVVNRGGGKLYKSQDECPNVLVYNAEYGDERIHAMQKPRDLARELVQRFTIPGDLVVDSFFGSGNLLAGAAELQRKIKGCDKNPLNLDLAIGNVANFYGG